MNTDNKKTETKKCTIPNVVVSSCKYGTNDCLNRQIGCKKCIDMSNYEWDYTDKY